jgi:hypothetical protein
MEDASPHTISSLATISIVMHRCKGRATGAANGTDIGSGSGTLRSLLRFAFTGCVCVFYCSCAIGPKLSRPKKASEN